MDKAHYLLELSRTMVLNPVRARLVELPEQWPWGSYRATAGLARVPEFLTVDWILSLFGTNRKVAREHYRTFVRAGIQGSSPWEELEGQVLLGSPGFVERFKGLLQDQSAITEIPRHQRFLGRPSLQELFQNPPAGGKQERDEKVYEAHVNYGYTLKAIADVLGVHYTTVSRIMQRAEQKK